MAAAQEDLLARGTLRAMQDFRFFCKHCVKIRDKDGNVVPLALNTIQESILRTVEGFEKVRRPVRVVVLKARQMGCSTFIQTYILWRMLRGDGVYRAVEIADDREAARDILDINRFTIKNLPRWFVELAEIRTEYFTKYEISFENTGCTLSVSSSDSNQPGRSRTIHLTHLSEAAFYNGDNARALLKSVMGALSKSSKSACFVESTANGPGGFFYNLYTRADAGKNEYKALFFPWYAHEKYRMAVPAGVEVYCPPELEDLRQEGIIDDEQLYWRQWIIANEFNGDEDAFRVEFPATPSEAFMLQSPTLFNKTALYQRRQELENMPYEEGFLAPDGAGNGCFQPQPGERMHVFERPVPGEVYVIGADVGSGVAVADGDASSADVIRVSTGQQVAHLQEVVEPVPFAMDLLLLGRWYNDALIGPEITGGHGLVVVNTLRDEGYFNVYHRRVFDKVQRQWVDKVGWNTSQSTRKMIIDNLRTDFYNGSVVINEVATIDEMASFVQNTTSGRYEAASGAHDDRVMSCLPPDTLIWTRRGQVPIAEVQIGDEVLTHLGRFRPVVAVNKRRADKLIVLRAVGKLPVRITPEHQVLCCVQGNISVKRDGKAVLKPVWGPMEWKPAGELDEAYLLASVVPQESVDVDVVDFAQYCSSSYRTAEDGTLVSWISVFGPDHGRKLAPNPKCNPFPRYVQVDSDFLMLCGYFLAEGWVGKHNVGFASHEKEKAIREWCVRALEKYGLYPTVNKTTPHGFSVSVGSVPLNGFFRTFGNKNRKRLPDWFVTLPPEKQRWIITGYALGDGCFCGKPRPRLQVATISFDLGFQMYEMLVRCGYRPTLAVRKPGKIGRHELLFIALGAPDTLKLIKECIPEEFWGDKGIKVEEGSVVDTTNGHFHAGYLMSRVSEVTEEVYDGEVYNLQVLEDESYVANGIVVHNCAIANQLRKEASGVITKQAQVNVQQTAVAEEPLIKRRRVAQRSDTVEGLGAYA